MKIDRVHIEHYKSLSNVTVEMHPRVTVLVGPNGSGKSNFVDALALLRDLGQGNQVAVAKRVKGAHLLEQDSELKPTSAVCQVFDASRDLPIQFEVLNTGIHFTPAYLTKLATIRWRFPSFQPVQLRSTEIMPSTELLAEDLENWLTIFFANRLPFERAVEAMRVVLPDLVDIQIIPAGNSYLIPTFHFKDDNGVEKSFDAAQLSDGTLHIFGLLLTLYQSPSPEVIVIEEPEQYLYPSMLALLADCIKEVSELTQIILTTHSHHLVEQFKLENIRVTTQKNGKTNISLVKKSQRYAVEQGLMTLGEIMAADGLSPELGDD